MALLTFAVMPASVGYQDLASLFARRASAGERAREHLIASPFGTIHAATFSFPRPLGSTIPEPVGYRVASLNLTRSDVTGSVSPRALFDLSEAVPPLDTSVVNRRLKGDRIVPRAQAEWDLQQAQAERELQQAQAERELRQAQQAKLQRELQQAQARAERELQQAQAERELQTQAARESQQAQAVPESPQAPSVAELQQVQPVPELQAQAVPELRGMQEDVATVASVAAPAAEEPTLVVASLDPTPPRSPALQGEISLSPPAASAESVAEPATESATAPPEAPAADIEPSERDTAVPTLGDDVNPTIRTARIYFGIEPLGGMSTTLEPWAPGQGPILDTDSTDAALEDADGLTPAARNAKLAMVTPDGGETIARKGEVGGAGSGLKSPAERLGLLGEDRTKHEKCLADAIYFEARGESVRGQMAVAQVVMNRVFSGYYPDNVCGVVYQNSHRHLSCQFTFACDGIPDKVKEPDAWERAARIARETLDGKYWLADVGKATHYHAYWVHPWWVRTMRKIDKIGVHTFYRPRRWGDGADTPAWGSAADTAEALNKM